MEALGNIKQIIVRAPQVSQAPVLPTVSRQPSPPILGGGDIGFDPEGAEFARMQALKLAARNAPQPLGTQAVTMFKDTSGQVITRFRDTTSGKVTYIPEPDLLSMTRNRAARAVDFMV
jgi:hypothetical protein